MQLFVFVKKLALAVLSLLLGFAPGARAITLQFDYSYDTNNFFGGANIGRRTLLDTCAQVFNNRFNDSLSAITPGGINTWTAKFSDPSSTANLSISNLSVGANTIIVFVGAQNLGSGILGEGGAGGYSAGGTQSWLDTVEGRGQSGTLATTPTDVSPWGGSVTFDLATSWYFDADPSTIESFAGKSDFYSVAVHELAHLLGLGTAASWDAEISGSTFTGAKSTAANGGLQVSLSGDLGHWADGTTSKIFGTNTAQEAAMDPSITVGTRKYFTTLDYAGLQDIGWVMVPEPSTWLLLTAGGAFLCLRRMRQGV